MAKELWFGSSKVKEMYFGSSKVKELWYGSTKIWPLHADPLGDGSQQSCYLFEDNLNDENGNYNITSTAGGISYGTGYSGKCLIDRRVCLNTNRNVTMSSSYTISGWFKHSSHASITSWILTSTTNGADHHLQLGTDAAGRVRLYSGGTMTGRTLSLNTWYHIVVCVGSGNSQVYVNGSRTINWNVGTPAGSKKLYLGGAWANYNTFGIRGMFDQIRFFNKKLSSSEVTTLYTFDKN